MNRLALTGFHPRVSDVTYVPTIQASLDQQIDNLFDQYPTLDYDRMIFQHPFLGSRNLPTLLDLMVRHDEVHQTQIINILNRPQFPIG